MTILYIREKDVYLNQKYFNPPKCGKWWCVDVVIEFSEIECFHSQIFILQTLFPFHICVSFGFQVLQKRHPSSHISLLHMFAALVLSTHSRIDNVIEFLAEIGPFPFRYLFI